VEEEICRKGQKVTIKKAVATDANPLKGFEPLRVMKTDYIWAYNLCREMGLEPRRGMGHEALFLMFAMQRARFNIYVRSHPSYGKDDDKMDKDFMRLKATAVTMSNGFKQFAKMNKALFVNFANLYTKKKLVSPF
jgi:hypothetical protein